MTLEYLLVNFGGPRSLSEVPHFLTELLQDRDLIRTKFPDFFHKWLFGRVARKRAKKIVHDYEKIGGRSPIYFDTEEIARKLSNLLESPVHTFHRYLPETHANSLRQIEASKAKEIRVIPLFPQFSYATTGSIARFLAQNLCCRTVNRLRWIKSYAGHPAFITSYQKRIADFLSEKNLAPSEAILLFSAHGVPRSFICTGDLYETECEISYRRTLSHFPSSLGRLSFQSKFGRGEWLRPYTDETCESILDWNQNRRHVVFVPITFTSDHIETLFEVEELYLPLIRNRDLSAYRCPALNQEPYWIKALSHIAREENTVGTQMLIRNPSVSFCCRL
ncbi:MAG: ferrochelatase [Verrucomicrobia bacterium]|nr:ferrochelatase [Verrucomicrobiota bacterium]